MKIENDLSVAPRPDLAGCNPTDPDCTPPDLAMPPPPDLAVTPPPDLAVTPPPDLAVTPPEDMTIPPIDMAVPPRDLALPPRDMVTISDMVVPPRDMILALDMITPPRDMAGTDGGSGAGGIGDACTSDADCKVGAMPSCWKANVLNNPANPTTPGGYCSAKCTTDSDCGTGASCVSLGTERYCLKACADATTCRHPGYACSFVAGGACYPDSIYDCNPKSGSGTCTEAGTMKAGGCLRQAFEDKGVCQASCNVGVGTCADRPMGTKRQCIYLDASRNGFMDLYKGLICVQSVPMPKATGASCTFLNECADGNECDPFDGKCHLMCAKSGMPGCPMGMTCADEFMTPAMGPGLCK